MPLDPINLPLSDRTYETAELGGLFGALRDAPEDGAGALTFGLGVAPPAPRRTFNRILQLSELRQAAAVIERAETDEEVARQLRDLVDPITSMGGARPKNGVEAENGLWIAKFPARDDRWNHAADELRSISSRPEEDRRELYHRMVFNALISNHDDHPRNHAVIAPGRAWELSPAFDLTPGPQHAMEHRDLALVCGTHGRAATASNLISQAPRFALNREEARQVIDTMQTVVAARWHSRVLEFGGSRRDGDAIASAFVYPGFFYDAEAGDNDGVLDS